MTAYGSEVAGTDSRRLRAPAVLGIALLGLVLATCGSGRQATVSSAPTSSPTTVAATARSSSIAPPPESSTPPPVIEGPGPTTPATATSPATTSPATTAAAATASAGRPAELDGLGDAGQAVVVSGDGYGSTTATLTTWQRTGGGWEPVHGPWTARIGRAGFAAPGDKREGDGRTPSGTYGFDFAFGVEPDPGAALPFRQVTGPSIVWDDNPSSPSYNLWVDGGRGEAMYVSPAYDFGAVIAYNTARTPGLGSAIFLHVSTGGPTAGCVSLPADRLLDVLRWLDPAHAPAIVMGVA